MEAAESIRKLSLGKKAKTNTANILFLGFFLAAHPCNRQKNDVKLTSVQQLFSYCLG